MMRQLKHILLQVFLAALLAAAATAQVRAPDTALEDLKKHVVNGPWTSHVPEPKGGAALYVLYSRTCPFCRAFFTEEVEELVAAGVDVRVIPVPTNGISMDVIAQLAVQRDLDLLTRFNANQPIAAPGMRTSSARVEAFNGTVFASQVMRQALQANGYSGWTPGFLYQSAEGDWYLHAGYSRSGFARVRTALLERAGSQSLQPAPVTNANDAPSGTPTIPACPNLLAWGYRSSEVDENRYGREYTRSLRPGGRSGTYRLWGLRPEQMRKVFGAPLTAFSPSDLTALKTGAEACLKTLDTNRRAARANWDRGRRRGDNTHIREMDDVHYRANMFFNLMLGMNRPINDVHQYHAVMEHQQSLARQNPD